MEDATAHPLAQLMKTHLKGNIFDPFKTDIVSTLFVYQHYQSTNNLKNTNLNKVAECLEWIGAEKYEQVPLYSAKDGKVGRTNLWVVRNHEVYRSMSKQDLARAYQTQTPRGFSLGMTHLKETHYSNETEISNSKRQIPTKHSQR